MRASVSVLQPKAAGDPVTRSSGVRKRPVGVSSEPPAAGSRALQRMLGIFSAVAEVPEGLSLAELSDRLASPKSSLLTLLRPLVAGHYLAHENSRYTLGNEAFVLASNIVSVRRFGAVVRRLMQELQEVCPETVVLAALDRGADNVVYTDVLESPQMIRYSISTGTVRPLHTCAAGQLFLAFQDEKFRNQYLRQVKFKRLTARTITNRRQLRNKLEQIRKTGLSVSVSEAVEGAAGVAAPIFGPEGELLAALLVAGPTERHIRDGRLWNEVARKFAETASRAVGFTGGTIRSKSGIPV